MPKPRPKLFRLEFYPDPHNSFVSDWPELPREVFRTVEDARLEALMFSKRWEAGGYSVADQCYWARDQIGEDQFRLTKYIVAEA